LSAGPDEERALLSAGPDEERALVKTASLETASFYILFYYYKAK